MPSALHAGKRLGKRRNPARQSAVRFSHCVYVAGPWHRKSTGLGLQFSRSSSCSTDEYRRVGFYPCDHIAYSKQNCEYTQYQEKYPDIAFKKILLFCLIRHSLEPFCGIHFWHRAIPLTARCLAGLEPIVHRSSSFNTSNYHSPVNTFLYGSCCAMNCSYFGLSVTEDASVCQVLAVFHCHTWLGRDRTRSVVINHGNVRYDRLR